MKSVHLNHLYKLTIILHSKLNLNKMLKWNKNKDKKKKKKKLKLKNKWQQMIMIIITINKMILLVLVMIITLMITMLILIVIIMNKLNKLYLNLLKIMNFIPWWNHSLIKKLKTEIQVNKNKLMLKQIQKKILKIN